MSFPPSLQPMRGRCNLFGLQFSCFFVLVLASGIQGSWSINAEGFALLKFRSRIYVDPYDALINWNPNDSNPCKWSGVHCVNDEVHVLDLNGLSLEGTLVPELGELNQLRSLVLSKNQFSGAIPKEIGGLTKLELLDLRGNSLSGRVPTELGRMLSLKRLLLSDNKFEGSIPVELGRLSFLWELDFDDNLTSAFGCINRKFGHCSWRNSVKQMHKPNSMIIPIKVALRGYINALPLLRLHGLGNSYQHNAPSPSEPRIVQNLQNYLNVARRKLLEQSPNLPAAPASTGLPSTQIITISSGSFPAVLTGKSVPNSLIKQPQQEDIHSTPSASSLSSSHQVGAQPNSSKWRYMWVLPVVGVLLIVVGSAFFVAGRRSKKTTAPCAGLSGQLQRALTKGIPKINRIELEQACEDFSNIIDTLDGCTVYKGTLSSGVEIAVASAAVSSSKEWSENAEITYKKKIEALSRVNHKNFVNLIGYCEDPEPFSRMMVFEYAPNGSLFEHLHVKEMEHLDWSARMRIIMGMAYCLQYMHRDLTPPVAHPNLNSSAILLTDDYAAKIADINFGPESPSKMKISCQDESNNIESALPADVETNIYSFGILLLEIISGKLPYSKEHGHLVSWATEYLKDRRGINNLVDPTLNSFKNNELDVICEVVGECIQKDPKKRPNLKDITSTLRQVIDISPDQATPRLSPLWWAELEILSTEAT